MSAPSIATIKRRVAAHYGVEVNDLESGRTARSVTRPRHVAMYLCRRLTRCSASAVARRFGGRDRTTVTSAWRGIEARMAGDPGLAAEIERLRAELAAAGDAPRPDGPAARGIAQAVRGEARALRERADALDAIADAAEADAATNLR